MLRIANLRTLTRAVHVEQVEVTMALPSERSNSTLLPDLPAGPLHAFRARASFSWRQLALFLESESELRLKVSAHGAGCAGLGAAGQVRLPGRWGLLARKAALLAKASTGLAPLCPQDEFRSGHGQFTFLSLRSLCLQLGRTLACPEFLG